MLSSKKVCSVKKKTKTTDHPQISRKRTRIFDDQIGSVKWQKFAFWTCKIFIKNSINSIMRKRGPVKPLHKT